MSFFARALRKAQSQRKNGIIMDRPYVICHMLTSLDGKIDGAFFAAPECAPAVQQFAKVRIFYGCDATLYGTTTMEGGYADGRVGTLPPCDADYPREDYVAGSDVKNYIVSLDPQGVLAFSGKYLEKKKRPRAHVIEALTEQASNEYLAYLRSLDISYVIAGKDQLDCKLLLEKLKTLFGIEKLMISGGGLTNWSFVQENMIDEFSLVIAPVADGSSETASVFEKADFLPHRAPAAFTLKDVEQIDGNVLWLRYLLKKQDIG